jgi:hypothetical protein
LQANASAAAPYFVRCTLTHPQRQKKKAKGNDAIASARNKTEKEKEFGGG